MSCAARWPATLAPARDLRSGLRRWHPRTRELAGRIVWINDPAARGDGGGLFPAGLAQYGLDPSSLTTCRAARSAGRDVGGRRGGGLRRSYGNGVSYQGQIRRGFDITATRRLMLRARESGVLALTCVRAGRRRQRLRSDALAGAVTCFRGG
jgi:hypothetical protein